MSLALVGTLADTHIIDALRQFAARSQGIRLELRIGFQPRGLTLSTAARRHWAYARPPPTGLEPGLPEPRAASTPVAARGMPGHHRPAYRRIHDLYWLVGERWVGFPREAQQEMTAQTLERQLMRAGLEDAEVTLIDSLTAQKRLAQAGFGLALVPESSVRDELQQGWLRRSTWCRC